jgi:predicted permease
MHNLHDTFVERLRAAGLRLRSFLHRGRLEHDLDDELAFHLAMREERNRQQGMNRSQAHASARRRFGNVTRVHEQTRRLWTFTSIETWWADVRYAFRMLRKTPVMTFVVILSLALGIGANTAIFSVLNAALLKPLPVPDPYQLQLLTWTAKQWPEAVLQDLEGTSRNVNGLTWSYSFPSYAFDYIRAHSRSFDNVLAFAANMEDANIGLNGHAESGAVQAVSGDFFNGMRIAPERGRLFTPADDAHTSPPVALVSYRFWRSRMGQDPAVAGKTISINGRPVTVIGVLPQDFYGIEPGSPPDVWITLSNYASQLLIDDYNITESKVWWLGIIARTKPGVTAAAARAELSVLFHQALHSQEPGLKADAVLPALDITSAARGLDTVRRQFSNSLFLLMAMVGLVLLIACANVAALLLARATARQREIAVRLSLGAARWRVVRQLLTESVLLALLGGAAGLLLAHWATDALVAMIASGRHQVELFVAVDGHVLLFTAVVAVSCGILFGVAPALRVSGVDLFPVLKQSSSQVLHGGHRFTPGRVLVGAQVALCLLLLVTAGLLGRTLARLQRVPLGFDPHHLVSFRVQPGLNGYKPAGLISYYSDFKQRLESLPGVTHVGVSQHGPIGSGDSTMDVSLPGYTQADQPISVQRHLIAAGYFETLGVPVLMGRPITDRDTAASPLVAVINQRMVDQYFHGDNPIGRTIEFGRHQHHMTLTIVGVVANVRNNSIRDDFGPAAYFADLQRPEFAGTMTFLLRTAGDENALMSSIRREALAVDKDVPVLKLRSEAQIIDSVLMMERLLALLSSLFGGLALLLACVGLYGTIGYTVVRRTNEIGIRMALGAGREAILAMILRETFAIVALGLLAGLPLAWFATRLLRTQLFDLSPHDPLTITISIGGILAVTILSGLLPARRASRVDPIVALRSE